MTTEQILKLQKNFFDEGNTLPYAVRKRYLIQLRKAVVLHEEEIYTALNQDLGKSRTESYMCEIGLVLSDLKYQIKHLKSFMKKKRKRTPLAQFKSKSYIQPSPRGNTLIISPWNYPVLLSLEPLTGAIAAGNTVILKPSEYSEATSMVLKKIIEEVFPAEYAAVVLGNAEVSSELLQQDFDYIFFTGGTNIGKKVAAEAGKRLIPFTLELGGKSPVIVDSTAKLRLAAKRIIFGKLLNCGQTCVAPDYVLVEETVKTELISELIYWIKRLYPEYLENPDYGKIINLKHFNRIAGYISDSSKIIYGGGTNAELLKIEPTILTPDLEDSVMQEEIFGPLLPVISYRSHEELLSILKRNPHPLALYLFSEDKRNIRYITQRVSFGGGCINDTIIHLATNSLPFGGVRSSGIGSYHGRKSFEAFSHEKSILNKASWLDLPIRYTPYTKMKTKLIKKFIK